MVRGHDCHEGKFTEDACSYPTRVGRILNHLFVSESIDPYHLEVSNSESEIFIPISNLARSATPTGGVIPSLSVMLESLESPPSAIFVDFSVNDLFAIRRTPIATEALIRFVRENYPSTEIFFVESFCADAGYNSYLTHKLVAEYYGVPFISYRSAVSPNCGSDHVWGFNKSSKHDRQMHPPWYVHRNIAYSIVQGLFRFIQEECSKDMRLDQKIIPLPSPHSSLEELRSFEVCKPISYYDANERLKSGDESGVLVYNESWRLFEDRKDKAGWISTKGGSVIEFDVEFGSQPRLVIGFLRSYAGMGRAKLTFPDLPGSRIENLNGLDLTSHTSQTFPMFVYPWGLDSKGVVRKFEGKTKVSIETVYDDLKFKIIYVLSC